MPHGAEDSYLVNGSECSEVEAINTDDFSFLSEMTEEEQAQFKALLNGENQNNAAKMIARLFV